MLVRVLTAKPGYPSGVIADIDDATALAWLGHGDVEPIRQDVAERATAEPQGEAAISAPRRSRRG